MDEIKEGDYVVATKYKDGDPLDQWCVGFYDDSFNSGAEVRHRVKDSSGNQFRHNGFRRVKKLSHKRGKFLVSNQELIDNHGRSVWYWVRCKMS